MVLCTFATSAPTAFLFLTDCFLIGFLVLYWKPQIKDGISEVCFKTRKLYQEIQSILHRHYICANKTKKLFPESTLTTAWSAWGKQIHIITKAKEHKTTEPAVTAS